MSRPRGPQGRLSLQELAPASAAARSSAHEQSGQSAYAVPPSASSIAAAIVNLAIIAKSPLLDWRSRSWTKFAKSLQSVAPTDARPEIGPVSAKQNPNLQIGALADQASVNIETIRYYERLGLMPAPARTTGGRRVYDRMHVQRLTFIRRSRELGFSLADVRKLLCLVDDADVDCCTIRDITVHHLSDIRGKIASLKRLERALRTMTVACRPGAQMSCPIFDALSGNA